MRSITPKAPAQSKSKPSTIRSFLALQFAVLILVVTSLCFKEETVDQKCEKCGATLRTCKYCHGGDLPGTCSHCDKGIRCPTDGKYFTSGGWP